MSCVSLELTTFSSSAKRKFHSTELHFASLTSIDACTHTHAHGIGFGLFLQNKPGDLQFLIPRVLGNSTRHDVDTTKFDF